MTANAQAYNDRTRGGGGERRTYQLQETQDEDHIFWQYKGIPATEGDRESKLEQTYFYWF